MAAALFLIGWLGYALMPILTPFAAALLLTYIGFPAHRWLVRRGINPSIAALLSMLSLLLALLAVMLILLPLLFQQVQALYSALGKLTVLIQNGWLPELQTRLGANLLPDFEHLSTWASEHSDSLRAAAPEILKGIGSRSMLLIQLVTNIVLTPVVFFYFLRDSERLIPRLLRLVPRRYEPTVSTLLKDIDLVLGAFLRGELMVMTIMAALYTTGLWAVGLKGALPLGLLTGILTFIPFVGSTIGLLLGTLAAFSQFGSLMGVLPTLTVFLIGQSLESNFITPKLVGERIGLHPVAVIFALMAFWQLFGFIGVLLALPVAAILQVGLSHALRHYRASHFYRRRRASAIAQNTEDQV